MRRRHLLMAALPLACWLSWKAVCTEPPRGAFPSAQVDARGFLPSDDGERMIDRRFEVPAGGLLTVRVPDADLHVETGAQDEAHVEVFLKARDMRRARSYFDRQHLRVAQEGSTVSVTAEPERGSLFSSHRTGDAQILIRARVPQAFDAELQTSDGDVRIGRLQGRLQVRTSDGDIETAAVTGPTISLRTSDGDVRAERLAGDVVTIQTSDGDVVLSEVVAARISIRTSDGDITADLLQGDTEAVTSDGDVRVGRLHGPSFYLRTSDGDVTAAELVAERAEVRTSDGNLLLERVDSPLKATTSSGHVRVNLLKPGPVSLRSSDGDITVTAPTNLPADLDLKGGRVRVASTYPFQGHIEKDRAQGRVNGGGPLLEAYASGGTVYLQDH